MESNCTHPGVHLTLKGVFSGIFMMGMNDGGTGAWKYINVAGLDYMMQLLSLYKSTYKMFRVVVIVIVGLVAVSVAKPHNHGGTMELRFKVSARDLKLSRFMTEKPFIKISAQDDNSNDEYHIGETSVLEETNDPDFPNVFKFLYDPSLHQRWHFKVRGSEAVDDDAHIGEVWVTVKDYVNADQYMEANLDHKGYIIIKQAY